MYVVASVLYEAEWLLDRKDGIGGEKRCAWVLVQKSEKGKGGGERAATRPSVRRLDGVEWVE